MDKTLSDAQLFGEEKISRILLKIAPPVMLARDRRKFCVIDSI